MFRRKKLLRAGKYLLWGALVLTSFVLLTDLTVELSTRNKVFNSTDDLPYNKVGLVLGAGKTLRNGRTNLFYTYRIQDAARLYKSGKVKFLLLSGDNSTADYDEPTTMKNDLIRAGVPGERIYLDYAGFRTLDSVVRCKEVFGQNSVTIVSQQFHNERAVFIASYKGMKAVGYNARGVRKEKATRIRERFARVLMVVDLLIGRGPKFLGEEVEIKTVNS